MPYIKADSREALEKIVDAIRTTPVMDAGELNYLFTEIARTYLKNHDTNYQRLNDIMGALEGCKQELYRRVATPYEESKLRLNGDVYDI